MRLTEPFKEELKQYSLDFKEAEHVEQAISTADVILVEPVVQPDDAIRVQSVMKLTLSCDHRVIDGSVGAEFLTDLRQLMEEPVRALY